MIYSLAQSAVVVALCVCSAWVFVADIFRLIVFSHFGKPVIFRRRWHAPRRRAHSDRNEMLCLDVLFAYDVYTVTNRIR